MKRSFLERWMPRFARRDDAPAAEEGAEQRTAPRAPPSRSLPRLGKSFDLFADEETALAGPAQRLDEAGLAGLEGLTVEIGDAPVGHAPRRGEAAAEEAPDEPPPTEQIVSLTLLAVEGERFEAADLLRAFALVGLKHGALGLFHRYADGAKRAAHGRDARFSVANLVEPGRFESHRAAGWSSPGLLLFLRLPGCDDGGPRFEEMLTAANTLARQLGGELRDDRRGALSAQSLQHIRDQIREFDRCAALERKRVEQRAA